MNNVSSVMRPAYPPTSSDVRPSTSVILASGATSHPLRTGSKIIGPGVLGVVCAATRSGTRTIARNRTRRLLFILRPQAHVDRRRIAAADLDVRNVGAVAGFLNFDRVTPFGDFDDQTILRIGSAPLFAVDQNVGVGRLHANRNRSVG